MANLRAAVDEKRRLGLRAAVHQLALHPVHLERQRPRDAERARAMAAEIGVDRLCWEITDHPEDSFSRRFAPGTPDYEAIRHEIWDVNGLGNAIPGATPRARIETARRRARRAARGARGRAAHAAARASATCVSGRSRPRRPTAGASSGSARSSPTADGAVIDRDYARAWLPGPIDAGQRVDVLDRRADAARPGPLPAAVRPRQRRHRLVRDLRVGGHRPRPGRALNDGPRACAPPSLRVPGRFRKTPSGRWALCPPPAECLGREVRDEGYLVAEAVAPTGDPLATATPAPAGASTRSHAARSSSRRDAKAVCRACPPRSTTR